MTGEPGREASIRQEAERWSKLENGLQAVVDRVREMAEELRQVLHALQGDQGLKDRLLRTELKAASLEAKSAKLEGLLWSSLAVLVAKIIWDFVGR